MTTAAMLAARGLDAADASQAAASLLGKAVIGQSTVIAFDTAFYAVALMFLAAAPLLVAIKAGIARLAHDGRSQYVFAPLTIRRTM